MKGRADDPIVKLELAFKRASGWRKTCLVVGKKEGSPYCKVKPADQLPSPVVT